MLTTKEYLELDLKKDKTEDEKQLIIDYNKDLISRYPFLIPRNAWTGEIVDNFNYTWSELDCVPNGWRIAFGEQLCEEIKQELLKAQEQDPNGGFEDRDGKIIPYLEGYRIVQIKEKFGELRWYDAGAPEGVFDIIDKYTKLSQTTCVDCGKPAEYISRGWICPWCSECANRIFNENIVKYDLTDAKFEDEYDKIISN